MDAVKKIIEKLGLQPHPEGGYFRETYRKNIKAGTPGQAQRDIATAIYFMITENSFSALHKLKSDEIYHFYAGDPLEMILIAEDGTLKKIVLGTDIINGEEVQVVVPSGLWQGTRLKQNGKWALLGTTMSPGFDFEDFEMASRQKLTEEFPGLKELITLYTHGETST